MVERKLRQLQGDEQTEAARTFVLLSGILGIEDEIGRRLRIDMIDVMENKVLGPAIRQGIRQGMTELLHSQLEQRFGTLPEWAWQKIEKADQETLKTRSLRLLDSPALEAIFQ